LGSVCPIRQDSLLELHAIEKDSSPKYEKTKINLWLRRFAEII